MPDASKITLTVGTAPGTPSSGNLHIYAGTNYEAYLKGTDGVERGLGTSGTAFYAGTAGYATTSGQAGTSAFATTASVCGTLGSNAALGTPSSGDLQNATLATPTTKGVVYLEPKLNLLPNTQRKAMSGCTLENEGSQLITGWTNGQFGTPYDTHTSSGADITSAIVTSGVGDYRTYSNAALITGGKLHKVIVTLTLNSGQAPSLGIIEGGDTLLSTTLLVNGANTVVYENTTTGTPTALLRFTNTNNTNWSATITLYEQKRAYTAADTLGPDGTTKTSTLDWHIMEQDATHGKGYYIDKYTKGANGAEYANLLSITNRADLDQYKGQPVAFGMAGYSVTATDNLKIQIYDGVGTTESAFWGADSLDWKEITRTVSASATELTFRVLLDGDTSDVAYGSFWIAVNGSSIGQWNFAPKPGEVIHLQSFVLIEDGATITTSQTLNVEALSSGKIGKGVKALNFRLSALNTAADKQISLWNGSGGIANNLDMQTQAANVTNRQKGWVSLDSSGDIYLYVQDGNFSAIGIAADAIQT